MFLSADGENKQQCLGCGVDAKRQFPPDGSIWQAVAERWQEGGRKVAGGWQEGGRKVAKFSGRRAQKNKLFSYEIP